MNNKQKLLLLPGLDHIANFLNSLDSSDMSIKDIRSAIYSECLKPEPVQTTSASDLVERLRSDGWSVAVHNDYRLDGVSHTFWLWTNDSSNCIKGEGLTDQIALEQCTQAAKAITALQAENDAMREALKTIAESGDSGRGDGLLEDCPAHEDVFMWVTALEALAGRKTDDN